MKTTYMPVMKPVLATVVSSSPAVWRPYAVARSAPTPMPAAYPDRGSVLSERQANGASTTVEIANRTARNANNGYSASASCTWTNVTPQTTVTPTRSSSGEARTRAG